MRRSSSNPLLPFADDVFWLSDLRCHTPGCDGGVTILASGANGNGAFEMAFCGPECGARVGWPWLASEKPRRAAA